MIESGMYWSCYVWRKWFIIAVADWLYVEEAVWGGCSEARGFVDYI